MKKIFVFIACLISSVSFAAEDSASFDVGTVDERVYRNEFLKFEFEIPKTWNYKFDEGQKILKKSVKKIYSENQQLRDYLDPDEIEVYFLLMLTKKPLANTKFTPNMILLIENVSDKTTISDATDYLVSSVRGLKMTHPNIKVSKKPFGVHQFGRSFVSTSSIMKSQGIKVRQDIYATIIGDFAFAVIASYTSKKEIPEMMGIMEGFTFED